MRRMPERLDGSIPSSLSFIQPNPDRLIVTIVQCQYLLAEPCRKGCGVLLFNCYTPAPAAINHQGIGSAEPIGCPFDSNHSITRVHHTHNYLVPQLVLRLLENCCENSYVQVVQITALQKYAFLLLFVASCKFQDPSVPWVCSSLPLGSSSTLRDVLSTSFPLCDLSIVPEKQNSQTFV